MNTYSFNDKSFVDSSVFQEFMKSHPARGFLKIRAYAASGAVPVAGLKVYVSTKIGDSDFIFFEGSTNESGIVDYISLPSYKLDDNNLDVPNKTVYNIKAIDNENDTLIYQVNIYENVYVIQNISLVPDMNLGMGD